MTVSVTVFGASGRLGKEILKAILSNPMFSLVQAIASKKNAGVVLSIDGHQVSLEEKADKPVSVIIDASLPEVLVESARAAKSLGAALLILSTGHDGEARSRIPPGVSFCFAPNASFGVFLLTKALRAIAGDASRDFRFEMIEVHHAQKKDAPSGTAVSLARAISDAGGPDVTPISLRGGTAPGEHVIRLFGGGEQLSFGHMAENRGVFAQGACKLAAALSTSSGGEKSLEELFKAI